MLSYRHAFHAGNHADVLKHATLALLIQYLKKKDKPFSYLDTHSGAGIYDLTGDWAQKRAEYKDGIARLWQQKAQFPELSDYFSTISALNQGDELKLYPGSPKVASALTRDNDTLELIELHSQEIGFLKQNMGRSNHIAMHHRDGFEGLVAMTPPKIKRGMVLIDPPYEIKEDYQKVVKTVVKAHNKWNNGIYAIWYPILADKINRSKKMLDAFAASGIRRTLVAELWAEQAAEDWGMHGSGMLIVNPPWQLDEQLEALCPRLAKELSQGKGSGSRVEWLVGE